MPICEADPWRMQYFENVPCPEGVRIPTEDGDAYLTSVIVMAAAAPRELPPGAPDDRRAVPGRGL